MKFTVIDFETATSKRNSACAIGIAIVEGGQIISVRTLLIKPPALQFNPINIGIHGITADRVRNEPTLAEHWPDILPLLANRTVIAYNASFDLSVLANSLAVYNISYPPVTCYCALKLARRAWPELPNHKLTTVAKHLSIPINHHDPSSDAQSCAKIILHFSDDTPTLADLKKKYYLRPERKPSVRAEQTQQETKSKDDKYIYQPQHIHPAAASRKPSPSKPGIFALKNIMPAIIIVILICCIGGLFSFISDTQRPVETTATPPPSATEMMYVP